MNDKCCREETPIWLSARLYRAFMCRMRQEAPDIPVGYRGILMHLAHEDGITQMRLAELTHLKAPTVSVTVRNMEADGYVIRNEGDDKRQIKVFLTEKGKQHDKTIKDLLARLEKQALNGLTEEETAVTVTVFKKMISNLEFGEQSTHEID